MTYQVPSPFVAQQDAPLMEDPQAGLRRNLRLGLIAAAVLVFGLFGLGALVQITGAVIGIGEVSVESKVKKIAHPTGGIIAELFVRDGVRVKRGQPLMRLDTTVSGVSASVSGEGLEQLLAARARLAAERDGEHRLVFGHPIRIGRVGKAHRRQRVEHLLEDVLPRRPGTGKEQHHRDRQEDARPPAGAAPEPGGDRERGDHRQQRRPRRQAP